MLVGLLASSLHVMFNTWVAVEVLIDVLLRFGAADADLLREAKSGHAINQTEINGFSVAALLSRDVGKGDIKYFGSSGLVNIQALLESVE